MGEPVEELHHCYPIAYHYGAESFELGSVFHGFHQVARGRSLHEFVVLLEGFKYRLIGISSEEYIWKQVCS